MQKPNNAGAPIEAGDQAPDSSLARGAFDLRAKREKKAGQWKILAGAIGGVLAFLVLAIGGVKLIMGSGAKPDAVDESTVAADPALQRKESDDDAYEKMLKQKRLQMQKEQAEKDRQAKLKEEERASAQASADTADKSTGKDAKSASSATTSTRGSSKKEPQTPAERRLASGVIIQPTGGKGSSNARAKPAEEEAEDQPAGGGSERSELNNLGGTRFASTKAKLAPDGTYLLAHNTYARCALYTEIITDNPALIECRLTDPLYSANGKTVLAEAGARLFGEQRTMMKQGQQRVFTAWTEMEANNGSDKPVRVRLDSLGAGPMGASGTQAWIDNHWGERIGGALMLSLFQDVMAGISNATQKGNQDGFTVNNTEQNVEGMGEKVLDNTINIPPTAYILPGTVMTVIVARDIDFSTVYQNR
ncbi:Type IV secretion system protein virB10 [compost metagenome]